MNERIKELRRDAGIYQLEDDLRLAVIDGEFNMIDPLIGLEKFAELIVRECEKVSLKNSHRDDMGAIIARQIKQHFGVEE